ncbi:MAG: hypothetical protein IH628_10600 [Proteobacteria bacterium]|nr:hypothetical protein [Pseudomonadota bacterium]
MSQNTKTLLMVLITIAAFFLAMVLAGWRLKKACEFIIRDLKEKKAFDPTSSVVLPYGKATAFRIGFKDYRPGALQQLVKRDIVRPLEGGRYYLRDGEQKIFNP